METLTRAQKIERLEKELADLREQERTEQEELRRKAKEERQNDLQNIQNAITEYNKKYNDTLGIYIGRAKDVTKLFDNIFPFWGD